MRGGDGGLLTTVTTLVSRRGHERRIAEAFEQTFSGASEHHLATLLIQQEGGLNFLISHFGDRSDLEAWRASPAHRQMIDAFEAHSLRELCTIDRPVVRITVPNAASGPKWKTLVASWVVTFPLLLTVVELLAFALPGVPFVGRIALTSIVISMLITWLISPFVLRATRTWRLRDQQMKIIVIEPALRPNA